MAQTVAVESLSQSARPQPHRSLGRKTWVLTIWIAAVAVYLAVIATNWPFTQQAVVGVLQQRSLRTVTIRRFYRTYFPPGCIAEDVRFLHRKHKEKPPLIAVRKLVLTTGYARILLLQERFSMVQIMDMHVTVPPSTPGQPNPVMPLTYSKSAPSIKIDRIIADGADLEFLSKTGKAAYRLIVDKLRLDGIGNNLPMPYTAVISNQIPPGTIYSAGVFGTWNPRDPGRTPVEGSYHFDDANLAAFDGISGTLSASGSFKGILREIMVQGTANTHNFKVYGASHERPLAVTYRAKVNGTDGDTRLDEVTARFDHTTAEFRGAVASGNDAGGKTAAIDMWSDSGRVEDILRLFISDRTSPMSGAFRFFGHADIPPGPQSFLRRVKLTADFGVAGGKFANMQTESDLTRLRNSVHKHRESDLPATNVFSELTGRGSAVDGIANLSDVSFNIPGAKAWVHGTYGLIDYKVDLHGTLLTSGNPSEATTGFKSLVVKAITPFFKRKHSEKLVPFKITGSYSKIDMSLDLGRGKQVPR